MSSHYRFLVLGLIIFVAFAEIRHPLSNNVYSLTILRTLTETAAPAATMEIREGHPMAAIWQAQVLMRKERYTEAADLLNQIDKGSPASSLFRANALCQAYGSLNMALEAVQSCSEIHLVKPLTLFGWRYFQEGELEKARIVFTGVMDLDPPSGVAGLAQTYIAENKLDEAERLLQGAVEDFPFNNERESWQLLLGKTLLENKKYFAAEEVFKDFIRNYPGNAEGFFRLGETLYHTNGFDAAKEMIEIGMLVDPTSPRGPDLLGNLLVLEGSKAEADGYFLTAVALSESSNYWIRIKSANNAFQLNAFDTAIQRYEAILDQYEPELPENAFFDIYYFLGLSYIEEGNIEAAKFAAEDLIRLKPSDPGTYIRSGRIYLRADENTLAIRAFKTALVLDPANETAISNLVTTLINENELSGAIAILREGLSQPELQHHHKEWRLQLGRLLAESGLSEEAQRVFESYIMDYPEEAEAYFHLGKLIFEVEGLSAARKLIEAGMRLDPADPYGPISLGDILVKEGLREEADQYYGHAVQLAGKSDFWIRLKWANNAFDGGNFKRAIPRYQDILANYRDQLPGEALEITLYLLGWSYAREEDHLSAIAAAEELLRIQPNNALTLARAGRVFELAGEADKAIQIYKQALEIDATMDIAILGLQRLSNPD